MKVEYIDHMGTDLTVVNAARVSFDKRKQQLDPDDHKLIKYLAKHKHWTPFGHPQVTMCVTAPVFVRTQCFKHKVGFVENEVSRRYVDSTPECYDPASDKGWRARSESSKQGSTEKIVHSDSPLYKAALKTALQCYESLLEDGVCPEQARMVLPQSMYTQWYWTGSLAAYARFSTLRLDPHAQREVQNVAKAINPIMETLFPWSWKELTND